MIVSPWNTTVLRQHKLNVHLSELALAFIDGTLMQSEGVTCVAAGADKVPPFVMPISSVEYEKRKVAHVAGGVVVDGRSFTKIDRNTREAVITNQMSADFFLRMGRLTALWVGDEAVREDFMRSGDIAASVYIRWISTAIVSKLGLDLEVAREVQIIVGAFYAHHFYPVDEVTSDKGKEKVVRLVHRWTKHPLDLVTSTIEQLPYMSHLEDLVEGLRNHFQNNTRIGQINAGFIVMSLGHSWFGYGAREISAVALEYPPVFLALVEAACNTKVWKRTHLGQIVDKLNIGRSAESFVRSMGILASQELKVSKEDLEEGVAATELSEEEVYLDELADDQD